MGPAVCRLLFFHDLQITEKDVVEAGWFKWIKRRLWGVEHGAEAGYKQQVAHTCRLIASGAFEVEAPLTVGWSL